MRKLILGFDFFVLGLTLFLLVGVGIFTIPRVFRITPFVIQSGSMEPELPVGSVVFVNRNDRDVEVGDIVTVGLSTGTSRGVYVTHRVHYIANDGLIQTKGDANDHPDGYLEADAILGKVCFTIPKIGFILDRLNQNYGYLIITIVVCTLNGVAFLFRRALPKKQTDIHEEIRSRIRIGCNSR